MKKADANQQLDNSHNIPHPLTVYNLNAAEDDHDKFNDSVRTFQQNIIKHDDRKTNEGGEGSETPNREIDETQKRQGTFDEKDYTANTGIRLRKSSSSEPAASSTASTTPSAPSIYA